MVNYIGEFVCKLDGKGRLMLPAGLRKQLPNDAKDTLIINRGFDACLVLYTKPDWILETQKLQQLNAFNPKDRLLIRLLNNGANELSIDGASRILIPKKLMEYASLKTDIVLFAYQNKIEIWDKTIYDQQLNINAEDLAKLANELLGGNSKNGGENVG